MKLSELKEKNPEAYKLALQKIEDQYGKDRVTLYLGRDYPLAACFRFIDTPEGGDYWDQVNDGTIPKSTSNSEKNSTQPEIRKIKAIPTDKFEEQEQRMAALGFEGTYLQKVDHLIAYAEAVRELMNKM